MTEQMKRLRDLVVELESIRGRHTELVTVYIPAGFNFNKVVEQIRNEQSTAQNIKSKAVRKNVTGALERILQHMKLYKQTPANGMAIFCGNVSDRDGVADIGIWALEPPQPINQRLYRCDQTFILDPLKDMIREREIYGLIIVDKSEADVGILQGKRIDVLKHLESLVPGKTAKGGWSANRYARIREGLLNDFMKKVGEIANANFKGLRDLRGIIVGGPGPVKDMFLKGEFLEYTVKQLVLGVVDTGYMGRYGLEEAVGKAEDILSEASVIKEKKLLERFFGELGKDTGLAVYGLKETYEALSSGSVEILLVSEGLDWKRAKLRCTKCGFEEEKILEKEHLQSRKCQKCGGPMDVLEERDVTDEIVKLAESMSSSVEFISSQTKEGNQLKEMGGMAGLLRYRRSPG